jgi:lysyl-tRNA synthetase class 2
MSDRGDALLSSRRGKLERLRSAGVDPYPARYHITFTTAEAVAKFESEESASDISTDAEPVVVAGRVISFRAMGKASFLHLLDGSGKVQVHLRRNILGDNYDLLKDVDVGDFIGVDGPMFRTHTGEATIEARSCTMLAKALRPLPEKWHGLRDVEQRYRQRYLDLVVNPGVKEVFLLRSRIIKAIRNFLDSRGFVEVDTPVLVPVAGGALAHPFVTHHNALDQRLYMRIATELYLKRLIIGGIDKVYELGRVFRNEGVDQNHNPEFTLLEVYQTYADYNDVMNMVEEMVSSVAEAVLGTTLVSIGGRQIDLAPPWPRLFLRQELLTQSGIDIEEYPAASDLGVRIRELGVDVVPDESRGRLIDKALSIFVEPHLIQPTFILDYPEEMSPLAKAKPGFPGYVERFEAFVAGMEIANAYTELNDPDIQRARFEEQESLRQLHGDENVDRMDADFLLGMEHGMPPTGGLGIGIDRMVMLIAGQRSIRDVLLFPQLRTEA